MQNARLKAGYTYVVHVSCSEPCYITGTNIFKHNVLEYIGLPTV